MQNRKNYMKLRTLDSVTTDYHRIINYLDVFEKKKLLIWFSLGGQRKKIDRPNKHLINNPNEEKRIMQI